jgi:teichuronic acid biosynthesis glycosyltransferase TuaH
MKRILYIMHVPWGWIKQRPHFIAESLSNDFVVDIKYRRSNSVKSYNVKRFSLNNNLNISGFKMIPFEKLLIIKYLPLDWINKLFFKLSIGNINKYDYIWITSPNLYNLIKGLKSNAKIIYDCMDDALEFPNAKCNKIVANKIFITEKELISYSTYIFCSSDYLKRVIKKRYNYSRSIIVVNNAINLYDKDPELSVDYLIIEQKIRSLLNPFIYIGTVSDWFDFDSVIRLLQNREDINVVLIGPAQETIIPYHERLHLLGSVKHEYIFRIMQYAKALIMPFQVNELINSVNPVKLYEYIYSGKPIISSCYQETEKFRNYAFLYRDSDDFIQLATNIINGDKKSTEAEMKQFALDNTWDERYNQIKSIIN